MVISSLYEIEYDKDRTVRAYTTPPEAFLVDLEVRGRIENNTFLGGLRCLPIVGAKIETLEDTDFKALFQNSEHSLKIGHNLFDASNTVYLDVDSLIPSHIGIFGNTGSGKSNTMSKILHEYVGKIPPTTDNAHILLFDLNNEYGGSAITAKENKTIYQLTTRKALKDIPEDTKIPLDFKKLTSDNWGTILRATQKTQMPVVRRAYRKWHDEEETDYAKDIKWLLVNKRSQVFFTLREYAGEYITGIDQIGFNGTTNGFYKYPGNGDDYINRISDCPDIEVSRPDNVLDQFLLALLFEVAHSSDSGTNFEFIQPLLPRARDAIKDLQKIFKHSEGQAFNTIYANKKIAVLQLGNVNSGTREIIPSLLSELVFQEAIENKTGDTIHKITNIVIDEAHNLLAKDSEQNDLIHDNTLRVFERIIKEGRKFGVYLCLASQRPSDISGTITSQIHNYFIHKLVNPNDIDRIRRTVSFMGDSSLSMLTALGKGECIISGQALYMPQYVCVDELSEEFKPHSNDTTLFSGSGIFTIAQTETSDD
jgi:hypothetical protein